MQFFFALILLHAVSTYALARLAKELWATHPIAAVALGIAVVGAVMAWLLFFEVEISNIDLLGRLGYLLNIFIPVVVAFAIHASFTFEDGVVPLLGFLAFANFLACLYLEILRD